MKIFLISAKPVVCKDEEVVSFCGIHNLITSDIYFLDYNLELDSIDALIFTSKNAIKSFLHNAHIVRNRKWQMIDSFIFGESSACYFRDNGGRVVYVKNHGNGSEFAKELCNILKNKRAAYFRAKTIAYNLGEILATNNINVSEIIAYESRVRNIDSLLKPPPKSILIFTAPSVYKAFLVNFGWDKSYIAVAIGDTTLNSFSKDVTAVKSSNQTIQSCVELARIIQEKNGIC